MALIIDNQQFQNQMAALQAASVVDGELGKKLREAIAAELKEARDRIVANINFDNGDPRGARHAVRRVIYKKILGGNINILDGRNTSSTTNYEPPRTLKPKQRGGNRRERGDRTTQIMGYGPLKRGFILRFVNSGTKPRYAGYGRNGKNDAEYLRHIKKIEGRGFRGSISPRNFFGSLGERHMAIVSEKLKTIIDEEFDKLFNE